MPCEAGSTSDMCQWYTYQDSAWPGATYNWDISYRVQLPESTAGFGEGFGSSYRNTTLYELEATADSHESVARYVCSALALAKPCAQAMKVPCDACE
jgi:hypothetical protein